jgi:hypothetical protein
VLQSVRYRCTTNLSDFILGAHLNWKLVAQQLRVVTEKFSDAPTRIAKREAPRERHVSMSANTR